MNTEKLKAGERYNFTLLYTGQSINNKFRFESPTGIHYILGLGDMEAVSPVSAHENSIKNTDPPKKYDPCRLFKKGDKVRVVEWSGRDIVRVGQIGYVVSDEHNSRVELSIEGWRKGVFYPACHLELITPVEELEPYVICENDASYEVRLHSKKENHTMAIYNKNAYGDWLKARYAAATECDRLNAEHRKEQN